jgi:hypothetical protein
MCKARAETHLPGILTKCEANVVPLASKAFILLLNLSHFVEGRVAYLWAAANSRRLKTGYNALIAPPA